MNAIGGEQIAAITVYDRDDATLAALPGAIERPSCRIWRSR